MTPIRPTGTAAAAARTDLISTAVGVAIIFGWLLLWRAPMFLFATPLLAVVLDLSLLRGNRRGQVLVTTLAVAIALVVFFGYVTSTGDVTSGTVPG